MYAKSNYTMYHRLNSPMNALSCFRTHVRERTFSDWCSGRILFLRKRFPAMIVAQSRSIYQGSTCLGQEANKGLRASTLHAGNPALSSL